MSCLLREMRKNLRSGIGGQCATNNVKLIYRRSETNCIGKSSISHGQSEDGLIGRRLRLNCLVQVCCFMRDSIAVRPLPRLKDVTGRRGFDFVNESAPSRLSGAEVSHDWSIMVCRQIPELKPVSSIRSTPSSNANIRFDPTIRQYFPISEPRLL